MRTLLIITGLTLNTLLVGGCVSYEDPVEPIQMPEGGSQDRDYDEEDDGHSSTGSGGGSDFVADTTSGRTPPVEYANAPRDKTTRLVREFCAQVSRRAKGKSVGCLPLVTHDDRDPQPMVTRLGEDVADEVSDTLGLNGADVLSTSEMGVRVQQANVSKATLSDLPMVVRQGPRLGVDVVVFGTIFHEHNVDEVGHETMRIKLTGWDLESSRAVAESEFDLDLYDRESRSRFKQNRKRSLWLPPARWQIPEPPTTLASELEVLSRTLAERLVSAVPNSPTRKSVYVPTTDVANFVPAIARLRETEARYSKILEETSINIENRVTGDIIFKDAGKDFRTHVEVENYLDQLRAELAETPANQFSKAIAGQVAAALRAEFEAKNLQVRDASFFASDTTLLHLLARELYVGGLSRNADLRNALETAECEYVAITRLARLGDVYVLRAELYDLAGTLVSSTHVSFEDKFADEIRNQLRSPN